MKKNILKLITMLLSIAVISCVRLPGKTPAKFFKKDLENASPDFKQGWEDGCKTGMAGGGSSFYQTFYDNNIQDGYKYSYSPDYKTAWNYSFWFCYRSDYIDQKSTPSRSVFGGLV